MPLTLLGACPDWVKRGLTVSYRAQLLAGTKSGGSAGSGDALFLVEGVDGGKPYGHFFLFANTYGGVFSYGLSGYLTLPNPSFFVEPREVDRWLKEKPPENCRVMGKPGDITVECKVKGEEQVFRIKYDRSGLIREMITGAWKRGEGWYSQQVRLSLTGKGEVKLPPSKKPPRVASTSRTYNLYLVSPMGTVPSGTLQVQYLGKEGSLLKYSLTGTGYSREVYGTPLMGPHYMSPELLKRATIISVPEAGFQVKATAGVGRTTVRLIYRGNLVEERVYDSSGLLLKATIPSVGGYTVIELAR